MEAAQEWGIRAMAVCVMLTIGLELQSRHLLAAFARPWIVATGMAINLLAMPAVAWLFWQGLNLEAAVGLALVLTAASPGGPVGALLTQHARGELGLAVAVIFVLALCSTAVLPALAGYFGAAVLPANVSVAGPVLTMLLVFQVAPLALAMSLRHKRPDLADRALPHVVRATKTFFVLVTVGMTIAKGHLIFSLDPRVLLAQVGVVVAGVGLGLLAMYAKPAERRALGMTAGIHNVAAAFLVVGNRLGDAALLTVLTYSMVMLLITVPVSHLLSRRPLAEPA